jgi:hypothetical protein
MNESTPVTAAVDARTRATLDADAAQLKALGYTSKFDRTMSELENFSLGFIYLSPVAVSCRNRYAECGACVQGLARVSAPVPDGQSSACRSLAAKVTKGQRDASAGVAPV